MRRISEPTREQLEAWDDAHVWHPFTPHSVYRQEDPLMVVEADGNYLIDADGNRYLDGVASIWCNAFGHRQPAIDDAIRAQLERFAHATFLGNASAPAVELAKKLVDATPAPLTRVFFSDNGSTTVEVALKMAYQYWSQTEGADTKRNRYMALGNAYHGDTVGSVSLGGIGLFHSRFERLLFDVERAPAPYCYRCPLGKDRQTCSIECLTEFERVFEESADTIAAVVLEPGLLAAGGMIPYPEGYLKRVREMASAAGTLLILDEVAVGMGRSGHLFSCRREGVTPDFLCVAKGLTGGYLPLAATITTEAVFEAFLGPPEEGRTFFHGHTYTGNALGAAAALATLEIFDSPGLFDELREKIDYLDAALERLKALPGVGDIRGYGLAAGIELVADRATKEPFPAADRRGMKVCSAARAKGVFLRPLGDCIVLMPPLSITLPEIGVLIDAVAHGVAEALPDAR